MKKWITVLLLSCILLLPLTACAGKNGGMLYGDEPAKDTLYSPTRLSPSSII